MSTRSDRHQLQQTSLRYHSELDRILSGTFTDLPRPFERLIDAIDCEPALSAHIEACKEKLPEGFDVIALVDDVTEQDGKVFGPLFDDPAAATAEAYLIVSELARRRTKFHSPAFSGYDDGSGSLGRRFDGFKSEVFMPLVERVTAHLEMLLEGLGPQDEDESELCHADALESLQAAVAALPEDQRAYAQLQAEALASELAQQEPNERLVDVLTRSLQLIAGTDEALAAALAHIQSQLI